MIWFPPLCLQPFQREIPLEHMSRTQLKLSHHSNLNSNYILEHGIWFSSNTLLVLLSDRHYKVTDIVSIIEQSFEMQYFVHNHRGCSQIGGCFWQSGPGDDVFYRKGHCKHLGNLDLLIKIDFRSGYFFVFFIFNGDTHYNALAFGFYAQVW